LSNLEIVDYVFLSKSPSAVKSIKLLKPNFYVKGKDYKKKSGDVAGNLKDEIKALNEVGGNFEISKSGLFSSTELLNFSFDDFNPATKIINKTLNGSDIKKKFFFKEYQNILKKIKNEKILIIGEIILDNYVSTLPLGKPSKEDILSVNITKKNFFLGGAVPIVKMANELNKNITFLSIYRNKHHKRKIQKNFDKNVSLKLFRQDKFIDIVKTRFLNDNNSKIFETYEHNSKFLNNNEIINFLKKILKNILM
jgi:bifunctional ADP-heptose synthase (sugar kinase/adenylyltransferase)